MGGGSTRMKERIEGRSGELKVLQPLLRKVKGGGGYSLLFPPFHLMPASSALHLFSEASATLFFTWAFLPFSFLSINPPMLSSVFSARPSGDIS